MTRVATKIWMILIAILPTLAAVAQSQTCPVNINFSAGNLVHWEAYTGNNKEGNGPDAIKIVYDSTQASPYGTNGATGLPEYDLPGINGIRVITTQGADGFGNFPMIPTIKGYTYPYSILLGSTAVAQRQRSDPTDPGNVQPSTPGMGPQGGYIRGVRYQINVPSGPPTVPYTMTYAYAMVLENGTHASLDQPMARAIVSTPAGIIDCASPEYYLPTNGGLDSVSARENGFTPSDVPTPNASPVQQQSPGDPPVHLRDVWTKGWTEVTFDLTAYRGQQVTLTFEADNCVPGGHFAYAYFAVKNDCAGLQIYGDTIACTNSVEHYTMPFVANANYNWTVPDGWTIDPPANSNEVTVTIGAQSGYLQAHVTNSCTDLNASLFVHLYKGALPQSTMHPRDTTICKGQAAPLDALVTTGTQYNWISRGFFAGTRQGAIPSVPFNTHILAAPVETTDYLLDLTNDGCPITVHDTFTVNIVLPIHVFAGNDTIVVVDEPLQFNATSTDPYKDNYQWFPPINLSNPDIPNPIGIYSAEMSSVTYQVTATDTFGCSGSGSVKVTIARSGPDIFVPNAFTPGTTHNALFRPVCYGISNLEYFRVFNRWGQLVFSTSQIGQGWDGRIHGQLQEPGSYLWIAKGTDYTGKPIAKKGPMMLIR
jgi:hypothetical protein